MPLQEQASACVCALYDSHYLFVHPAQVFPAHICMDMRTIQQLFLIYLHTRVVLTQTAIVLFKCGVSVLLQA